MPDIVKIYVDLVEQGKADGMTLEDICAAISEYSANEEYFFTSNTTAPVSKDRNKLELSSNECIEELTNQQADALLVQMINNINTIEIEGGAE